MEVDFQHLTAERNARNIAAQPERSHPMRRHLVPALALIVVGTLFLLDNLGLGIDAGRLLATWWPLALVAAGLHRLARPSADAGRG